MRARDSIPGERITGEAYDKILADVLSALNPDDIPELERFYQYKRRTAQEIMHSIKRYAFTEYYIVYAHPVNIKYYRLYITDKNTLVNFIDSQFNDEFETGIDIIVSDKDYNYLFLGNHDGMLMEA